MDTESQGEQPEFCLSDAHNPAQNIACPPWFKIESKDQKITHFRRYFFQ